MGFQPSTVVANDNYNGTNLRTTSKVPLLTLACFLPATLPETNIASKNGWLEYYFPIGEAYFQGRTVSFRECSHVSFPGFSGNNSILETSHSSKPFGPHFSLGSMIMGSHVAWVNIRLFHAILGGQSPL